MALPTDSTLADTDGDAVGNQTVKVSAANRRTPRAASKKTITTDVEYQGEVHTLVIHLSRKLGAGGFGKVYEADMVSPSGKVEVVAVKAIDKPDSDDEAGWDSHAGPTDHPESGEGKYTHSQLEREIAAWKHLVHAHILRFYGLTSEFAVESIGLVSRLAPKGSMKQFITKNPTKDRLKLLHQVADGLKYLHLAAGIVHGDLKCSNVVIDADGNALIADFGLSTVIEAREDPTKTAMRIMKSVAFAAPELLDDEAYNQPAEGAPPTTGTTTNPKRSKTIHSDSFAFARLIYETCAGEEPWRGTLPTVIWKKVTPGGEIPPRHVENSIAVHISDDMWALCVRCWANNPFGRPDCVEILRILTAEKQRQMGAPAVA